MAAVPGFTEWLHFDRLRRELQYRLNGAFDKLLGQVSATRLSGLQELENVVRAAVESEAELRILSFVLADKNFSIVSQIMVVLARRSYQPLGEITKEEKLVALNIMRDLCTFHVPSRNVLEDAQYVEALMDYLNVPGLELAAVCALEAALIDHTTNQQLFERAGGLRTVAAMLTNRRAPEPLRLQCAEFLYLLLMPDQDLETKQDGESERHRNVRSYLGTENTDILLEMVNLNDMESSLQEYLAEIDDNSELA